MNIIIVGCGKVGSTLAEQLVTEKHDVVIIDNDEERLEDIGNELDVMCVHGNGASVRVLEEAGAAGCDLVIAMMKSDELNLLTCLLSKKLGAVNTIARIRNPIYSDSISLIKDDLGLSMTINPELAAANEISRLLRFPQAIKLETFAKGRVEILKHKIAEKSLISGVKLSNLQNIMKLSVLVCAVERRGKIYIPTGEFVLEAGDVISFVAPPKDAMEFFRKLGMSINKIKDIVIIGGGRLTYYLSKNLLEMGVKVKIIEINPERCEELSELLPDAMIIHGDGTDNHLLHEEGICEASAVATLTGLDEQNVLMSIYATQNVPDAKIITKIKHFDFDDILKNMNIGSVIYPKYITADYILRYVRVMQNSLGSNVETLHRIVDDKVEALEFRVREHSPMLDTSIETLNIKKDVLIACINRQGHIFTPGGRDTIQLGDTVIVVTIQKGLYKLTDIIE